VKEYCLDTSGLSHPLQNQPEDLFPRLWEQVHERIESGRIAVTEEIYEELAFLTGDTGACIVRSKSALVMKVGASGWDYSSYLTESTRIQTTYARFISENVGGRRDTICMNDISIVALAKSLGIPVVSMEVSVTASGSSSTKRRIPDICKSEGIVHLSFTDFMRREGIKA
jgi:hypothetical protein